MNIPPIALPNKISKMFLLRVVWAVGLGLIVGAGFILIVHKSPLTAYRYLISSGFGCMGWDNCAILTTLQFATPLILAGLSAAVAFRAGMFSIGQAGQMILGAAMAAWVGSQTIPKGWHPIMALGAAALAGALWAAVPAILRFFLDVHEIIVTAVMNIIAGFMVGFIPLSRGIIEDSARLATLAPGTKLNTDLFLALFAALYLHFYMWNSARGYELRMVGQAPKYAKYGGLSNFRGVMGGMLISGGLAGLAGAVEILGVHYRYITGFSADQTFDGVMVAILGQSNPLGVLVAAIFVGGIRLGSLNGLLLQADVPRELGNAILAVITLFIAANMVLKNLFRKGKLV